MVSPKCEVLRLIGADQHGAHVSLLIPTQHAASNRARDPHGHPLLLTTRLPFPRPRRAANANILVDPAYQVRGVGRKLVTEAPVRWPTMIRTSKRYSEDGVKFRLAMEGKSRWD